MNRPRFVTLASRPEPIWPNLLFGAILGCLVLLIAVIIGG